MLRYIKIALIFFVAVQGLVGGIGNIAGLSTTHSAVARTLAMDGVPATVPRIFATGAPVAAWFGVAWIVLLKLATGVAGGIGAWQLWRHRSGSAAEFQAAKRWGIVACGASILMLYGGFIVVATTMLFIWQAPTGQVAFEGATYFLVALGVVALFVNMRDE